MIRAGKCCFGFNKHYLWTKNAAASSTPSEETARDVHTPVNSLCLQYVSEGIKGFPIQIEPNHGISRYFCYVTLFYRKSNLRTEKNREVSKKNNCGERFSWEMNNFCKMNFPDSQKIFRFEPHSDSDSSATDQKSIIFREIHQNTSLGRILVIFR